MSKHKARSSDDPALDSRVRTLLSAAAAPAETTGPLPGEKEALAAFRASPQRTKRTSVFSRLVSAKVAMASAIGTGVLLTGGVGAAAAGVLPGAAQETVSTWLGTVGIDVPAGEKADENSALRGRSEQAPVEGNEPPAADNGRANDNGKANDNSQPTDNAGQGSDIGDADNADEGNDVDQGDNAGQRDDDGTANDGKPHDNGKPNDKGKGDDNAGPGNNNGDANVDGDEIAEDASDDRVESSDDSGAAQTP